MNNLAVDLSKVHSVAIFGQGNVALDCARVLLKDVNSLSATDISQRAVEELKKSAVERVYLIGRRGPAQMAATPKELRELLFSIQNIRPSIVATPRGDNGDVMQLTERDSQEIQSTRVRRRVYETLSKVGKERVEDQSEPIRDLNIQFFSRPLRFMGIENGSVTAVELEHVMWEEKAEKDHSMRRSLKPTGMATTLDCQLVIKSIGYNALPVDGVPYEARSSLVQHDGTGRVHTPSRGIGGLYACG